MEDQFTSIEKKRLVALTISLLLIGLFLFIFLMKKGKKEKEDIGQGKIPETSHGETSVKDSETVDVLVLPKESSSSKEKEEPSKGVVVIVSPLQEIQFEEEKQVVETIIVQSSEDKPKKPDISEESSEEVEDLRKIQIDLSNKEYKHVQTIEEEGKLLLQNSHLSFLKNEKSFQGIKISFVDPKDKDQYIKEDLVEREGQLFVVESMGEPNPKLEKVYENFHEKLIDKEFVKEKFLYTDEEIEKTVEQKPVVWSGILESLKSDPANVEWSRGLPLLAPSDKYLVEGEDMRLIPNQSVKYFVSDKDEDFDGQNDYVIKAVAENTGYFLFMHATEDGLKEVAREVGKGDLFTNGDRISLVCQDGKSIIFHGLSSTNDERLQVDFLPVEEITGVEMAEKYPNFVILPHKDTYVMVDEKLFNQWMDMVQYHLEDAKAVKMQAINESELPLILGQWDKYLENNFDLPLSRASWERVIRMKDIEKINSPIKKEILDKLPAEG